MAAMRIQQVQRLVLAKKNWGVRCTLTFSSPVEDMFEGLLKIHVIN